MLNREVLTASEAVYNGCQEQPVDVDISLPDYCPDIQRVLKCQVCPSISSRSVSGDRLEIEGTYTVRVLYLDSGGQTVRCYETENTFLSTAALKQPVEAPRIYASAKLEYVNCRATSPRRLDIHGAFSVCARVCGRVDTEAVASVGDSSTEELHQELAFTVPSGFFQQPFTVEESLELPTGKLPADRVLRMDATAICRDYRPMSGQLHVSGDIRLRILYATAEENLPPETMEYQLPFEQSLDCDDMAEGASYRVQIAVSSVSAQVHSDYTGEVTSFEARVRLLAAITCFEEKHASLLRDAYSRSCELQMTRKQKEIESLSQLFNDVCTHKFSVECEAGLTKVLDIWSEVCTVNGSVENGELKFTGKLNICVLAMNAENTPIYFERSTDFACSKPCEGTGTVRCVPEITLRELSYRLTGGGMDLKAELEISAELYEVKNCNLIVDASLDESKPRAVDRTAALSLYFADSGESLWEIARNYCSSVAAIRAENDLVEDVVSSRGMLLIPM